MTLQPIECQALLMQLALLIPADLRTEALLQVGALVARGAPTPPPDPSTVEDGALLVALVLLVPAEARPEAERRLRVLLARVEGYPGHQDI